MIGSACPCKCHTPGTDVWGKSSPGISHAYPCCTTCQYCGAHVKDGAEEHVAACERVFVETKERQDRERIEFEEYKRLKADGWTLTPPKPQRKK